MSQEKYKCHISALSVQTYKGHVKIAYKQFRCFFLSQFLKYTLFTKILTLKTNYNPSDNVTIGHFGMIKPNNVVMVLVWVKDKLFHGPDIIFKENNQHCKKYKITIFDFLLMNVTNRFKGFFYYLL